MEWLLIGLIILVILVNIRSFIVLSQFKKQRTQMLEDTETIHQSMEEFVTNLEKENEELYHKLVYYIKVKESKLDERIRQLEEQLDSKVMRTPIKEDTPHNQDDEMQTIAINPNVNELENEKISTLYKQGFSPKQITKVLQIDHGEVELVINMLRKKESYHK
jgi:flagellar basal body-associated protein FliL